MNKINLSHLDKLTYSAIMRELNKECPSSIPEFMKIFKIIFDSLVLNGEPNPAERSLFPTLALFAKKYDLVLDDQDQNQVNDIVSNSRPLSKWMRDQIEESDRSSFAPFLDPTKESPYIIENEKVPFIDGTGPTANIGTTFVEV